MMTVLKKRTRWCNNVLGLGIGIVLLQGQRGRNIWRCALSTAIELIGLTDSDERAANVYPNGILSALTLACPVYDAWTE